MQGANLLTCYCPLIRNTVLENITINAFADDHFIGKTCSAKNNNAYNVVHGGCPLDSRMTWSVLLSVDPGMALQPQSGIIESEAGGTLEGHCHGRGRSSSVAMIMSCKMFCSSLFSSNALVMCMSTYQWGGSGLLH